MKENDLIARIRSYLKTVDNLFFWKEHGGQYGTAGIPDIIRVLPWTIYLRLRQKWVITNRPYCKNVRFGRFYGRAVMPW